MVLAADTDEERRVAVLRDVLAGCDYVPLDDLRAVGCPETEVNALDAITRRKDLGGNSETRRACSSDPGKYWRAAADSPEKRDGVRRIE